MTILISGSLAYDRIMDFPGRFADHILHEKIHILNVCFTVNGLKERFGGTAGNIAYTLSLLGERPEILATCGKDFDHYRQWLEDLSLPQDGIRHIPDEFTASAYITTDKADNQITGFNPGAMKYPSEYNFDGLQTKDTLAILSPGNTVDMIRYSREYKQRHIDYICDPGQQIPVIPKDDLTEMIQGSHILVSNDYELELIQKHTGQTKADLLEQIGNMITTLGEKGAVITQKNSEEFVAAAPPKTVSDPTGAGDAFRSGLIKGLVSGKDLVKATQMGAVAASFSVEVLGTQEHRFTSEEFWHRYDEAF